MKGMSSVPPQRHAKTTRYYLHMAYEKMERTFPCMCGNGKMIASGKSTIRGQAQTGTSIGVVSVFTARLNMCFIPPWLGGTSFVKVTPRSIVLWSSTIRQPGGSVRISFQNTSRDGLTMFCFCQLKQPCTMQFPTVATEPF